MYDKCGVEHVDRRISLSRAGGGGQGRTACVIQCSMLWKTKRERESRYNIKHISRFIIFRVSALCSMFISAMSEFTVISSIFNLNIFFLSYFIYTCYIGAFIMFISHAHIFDIMYLY